jgi:hypothetical protein
MVTSVEVPVTPVTRVSTGCSLSEVGPAMSSILTGAVAPIHSSLNGTPSRTSKVMVVNAGRAAAKAARALTMVTMENFMVN